MNQQNFDNPQTLDPMNKNDCTVYEEDFEGFAFNKEAENPPFMFCKTGRNLVQRAPYIDFRVP